MKSSLILILVVLTTLNYSCKKKSENKKPQLEILTPSEGTIYSSEDEIKVKVIASDDQNIKLIKVVINDENSVAIVQSQTLTINEVYTEKTFKFKVNDSSLKSSKCFVSVLVSDGALETKKYLEITIQESPKKITGYITGQIIGSSTNIKFYDNLGNIQHSFLSEGQLQNGVFFSSEQLFVHHTFNSSVKALKLPTFSQVWEYSNSQVNKVIANANQFYLLKSDYYTTGYNIYDLSMFKSFYEPTFTYSPYCGAIGTELLCIYQMPANLNAQKKLILYDINTSSILKECLTNNTVKSIVSLSNSIFVMHQINSINQHQIALYDFNTNSLNSIYQSPTPINTILKIDDNRLLIHSNTGLGVFNMQSLNFQMLVNNTLIACFDFNTINNEIYLSHSNKIERYSLEGNLVSSLNLDYQPSFLGLTYNK